ncbi:U-box domain-containing protein [Legionella sp. WA2022007384]
MELKIEAREDADVFIYGKMDPNETNRMLLSKVSQNIKPDSFSKIAKLQHSGAKLWLIRDSRVPGLLTVQSISWNKEFSFWGINEPERYMLSNHYGWILNNSLPDSDAFLAVVDSVGGFIDMTEDKAKPHLPGLLKILSENGYDVENRVNPKVGEQTQLIGYTSYHIDLLPPKREDSSPKLESTEVCLPEGLIMALSCPITLLKTGQMKVMKDPVTRVIDGISYERGYLLEKYPDLQEGTDFYPNIRLKAIINYISATSLKPEDYWAKLQKIDEDIKDPIFLETLIEPVLSPSGHSYEKKSIEEWIKKKQVDLPTVSNILPIPDPTTDENIRGKPLILNKNLMLFIKAWPAFYEDQEFQLAITLSKNNLS